MAHKTFYSKSNGMLLDEHLFETGENSFKLSKKLTTDKRIQKLCLIAGLFHDIGKARFQFQKHIMNGDVEKIDINHGVASAVLFKRYVKCYGIEEKEIEYLLKTFMYHHPITKEKSLTYDGFLDDFEKDDIKELICRLIEKFNGVMNDGTMRLEYRGDYNEYEMINLPDGYFSKDIDHNGNFFIILNTLKFADILSSDKRNTFDSICNRSYSGVLGIKKPEGYDDRFYIQEAYSNKLFSHNISMFDSQTSFGKTMLGIMYLLKDGKKGYWICPRNTIAEGIYQTIVKELNVLGLGDKVSVSLLLGGKFIEGVEGNRSDIIVTNIDNFMRPQIKSDSKDLESNSNIRSYNMLYCNCIFDEYHEYVGKDAILGAYLSIMKARKRCNQVKTLLLSATSIGNLYKPFIDNGGDYEYKCENILSRKLRVLFSLPDGDLKDKNYFYSVNTVSTCQKVYNNGNVDNIIHARYTDEDKEKHFCQLYNEHGKGCFSKKSWVGNNVISTGVDVSFGNMVSLWPSPEKFIQSLGRCNRWNECVDIPNIYINLNTNDRSEKMGVNVITSDILTENFYKYLEENFTDGAIITLGDLYEVRRKFYELSYIKDKLYRGYYGNCVEQSLKNLVQINYMYSNPSNSEVIHISNKPGLRSNENIFNFFALFKDDEGNDVGPIQVDNQIININRINDDDSLTDIMNILWHSPNRSKYFTTKKHYDNMLKNKNKLFDILINKALCSETPIPIYNRYGYNKEIGIYKK